MSDESVNEQPAVDGEDNDSSPKKSLLETQAEFYWLWGKEWLIETPTGNYRWSDLEMGGDNTIRPYSGTVQDLCKELDVSHACPKGNQVVGVQCGRGFQLVEAD